MSKTAADGDRPPSARPAPSPADLLDFVKCLGIDPATESEMAWIAEEAWRAPLPPGWEERLDKDGRASFHNSSTGATSGRHPMESSIKDVVGYFRQVQSTGGFWDVEDDLREREQVLQGWTEQDEPGAGRLYYNELTGESTPDDPRPGALHDFALRAQLVEQMMARLPMLAPLARPFDRGALELFHQLEQKWREEEAKKLRQERAASAPPSPGGKLARPLSFAPAAGGAAGPPARKVLDQLHYRRQLAERLRRAATTIQRIERGKQARRFYKRLLQQRQLFLHMQRCVVTIQCAWRVALARREVKRREAGRRERCAGIIQGKARTFLARTAVVRLAEVADPLVFAFELTQDPRVAGMLPWCWRLWTPATDFDGKKVGLPYRPCDLFHRVGAANVKGVAAIKIQALVRRFLARSHVRHRIGWAQSLMEQIVDAASHGGSFRARAATRIQSHFRGHQVRKLGLLRGLRARWLERSLPSIFTVQAYFARFTEQGALIRLQRDLLEARAATRLQSAWRGCLARRHAKDLAERALWPLKVYMDYMAAGKDSVHVEVRFLPNPRFNESRYVAMRRQLFPEGRRKAVTKLARKGLRRPRAGPGRKSVSPFAKPPPAQVSVLQSDGSDGSAGAAVAAALEASAEAGGSTSSSPRRAASPSPQTSPRTQAVAEAVPVAVAAAEGVHQDVVGHAGNQADEAAHTSDAARDAARDDVAHADGEVLPPPLPADGADGAASRSASKKPRARAAGGTRPRSRQRTERAAALAAAVQQVQAADEPGADAEEPQPATAPPEPKQEQLDPALLGSRFSLAYGSEALKVLADASAVGMELGGMAPRLPRSRGASRGSEIGVGFRGGTPFDGPRSDGPFESSLPTTIEYEAYGRPAPPSAGQASLKVERRMRRQKKEQELIRQQKLVSSDADSPKSDQLRSTLRSVERLEEAHRGDRERRLRLIEKRWNPAASQPVAVVPAPFRAQRVLHRHVHHHVHYHDAVEPGGGGGLRAPFGAASAPDLRFGAAPLLPELQPNGTPKRRPSLGSGSDKMPSSGPRPGADVLEGVESLKMPGLPGVSGR